MQDDLIRIAGVSERDTDLLFLEEFMSSSEFVDFFLKKVGWDNGGLHLFQAARSVTDSTGESDIEIILCDDQENMHLLLIENKVNAGFQPMQAERYIERGENYIKHGKVVRFITVLIAPESYFSGETKGFNHRVDYEELREWFNNSSLLDGRKKYKLSILTSAIEKSSSGYQLIADATVSHYWNDYWNLTRDIAPEFCMTKPKPKASGSSFIYFRDTALSNQVVLVHKLVKGRFDIQFARMGGQISDLKGRYGDILHDDMYITKAAKSAVIRIDVPSLSAADTLENQRDKTIKAIDAGKRLLAWGVKNIIE